MAVASFRTFSTDRGRPSVSLASSNRLEPRPGHVHSSKSTRRQLLESAQRRIQIVRLATRTSVYYLKIYTSPCAILFIVSARSQHLVAEWVVVAVAACAGRRASSIKDNV